MSVIEDASFRPAPGAPDLNSIWRNVKARREEPTEYLQRRLMAERTVFEAEQEVRKSEAAFLEALKCVGVNGAYMTREEITKMERDARRR